MSFSNLKSLVSLPGDRRLDNLPAGFALGGKKWDGVYVGRRKGADLVYAGIVPGCTLMGNLGRVSAPLVPLMPKLP